MNCHRLKAVDSFLQLVPSARTASPLQPEYSNSCKCHVSANAAADPTAFGSIRQVWPTVVSQSDGRLIKFASDSKPVAILPDWKSIDKHRHQWRLHRRVPVDIFVRNDGEYRFRIKKHPVDNHQFDIHFSEPIKKLRRRKLLVHEFPQIQIPLRNKKLARLSCGFAMNRPISSGTVMLSR